MKGSLHLLNLLDISCVKSCKIQWRFLRYSFLMKAFFLILSHDGNHLFITTLANLGSIQLARVSNVLDLFSADFFFNDWFLTLGNSSYRFLTVKETFSFYINTVVDKLLLNIDIIIAFSTYSLGLDLSLVPIGSSLFSCFWSLLSLFRSFLPFLSLFFFCSFSVMHRPLCLLLWLCFDWNNVISLLHVSVTGWRRLALISYTIVSGVWDFKKLFRPTQNSFRVWGCFSFFCSLWVTKSRLSICSRH